MGRIRMAISIYLDQNKWIDVARTLLGKNENEELKEVCNLIKEKVGSKEWVFPLSIIHHMETMARLDERSRTELARVMGEISQNYAILPYVSVDEMEFSNSIRKAHKQSLADFSKEVVTQDFVRAAGLDGNNPIISGITDQEKLERVMMKFKEEMRTRNLFYEFMQQQFIDKDEVAKTEQENNHYKQCLETIRTGIRENPNQFRYSIFIIRTYFDYFKPHLTRYAEECKKHKIPVTNMIPQDNFKDKEKPHWRF